MGEKSYYDILGVTRDASQEDIKRAFRKKAATLHPDKNKDPDAHKHFKELNEAYQTISDPQKRKRYDQFGAAGVQDNAGGYSYGNTSQVQFDFSDLFGGGFESIFGNDNPFGDVFGQRSQQQNNNNGEDIAIQVKIELADVIKGPEKEIKYNRKEKCKACNGLGGEKVETCKNCNGKGKVAQVSRSFFGNIQVMKECPECKGTGKKILDKCKVCKGESVVDAVRAFKIRIPKGIENGLNLRFRSEGNAGRFGGQYGDLFVQINILPDKKFKRESDNLLMDIELPVHSLILGDEIQVKTLDGDKLIKIPQGLDVSEKLVLKELGVPNMRTQHRGNLILNIKVEIPKKLTKEEKDLYSRLKEIEQKKDKKIF